MYLSQVIYMLPVVKDRWRNRNPNPIHTDFDVPSYCKFVAQVPHRNCKCYALSSCSIIVSIIWSCHLRKDIILNLTSVIVTLLHTRNIIYKKWNMKLRNSSRRGILRKECLECVDCHSWKWSLIYRSFDHPRTWNVFKKCAHYGPFFYALKKEGSWWLGSWLFFLFLRIATSLFLFGVLRLFVGILKKEKRKEQKGRVWSASGHLSCRISVIYQDEMLLKIITLRLTHLQIQTSLLAV